MSRWKKEEEVALEMEEAGEIPSLEELEEQTHEEIDEIKQGFRDRAKAEQKRFVDVCDTGYWFCVAFSTRAQKEEMLALLGIEPDLKYVDGKEFARAVKKSLKNPDQEFAKIKAFDKDYVRMARDD